MLWFFDKGKKESSRRDSILFIDARHIFRKIDRAHRDFTPAQIEYITNIVRLHRGKEIETQYMKPTEPIITSLDAIYPGLRIVDKFHPPSTKFPQTSYSEIAGIKGMSGVQKTLIEKRSI